MLRLLRVLPLQTCLPWVGEDGATNRHLLHVFLASCLAVLGLAGVYAMQRYVQVGVRDASNSLWLACLCSTHPGWAVCKLLQTGALEVA